MLPPGWGVLLAGAGCTSYVAHLRRNGAAAAWRRTLLDSAAPLASTAAALGLLLTRAELVPSATDFLSRIYLRRIFSNELPYVGDGAIDRTLSLTSAILRETSIRTRARGAIPLFVIPILGARRPLAEHPEAWILRALFVKQELPFILVDLPPDQRLNEDFHPGPRGAESIATAILAALPAGS